MTLLLASVAGTGAALASANDDGPGLPITGQALPRAIGAALDETGGGTVTATQVDDEDSKYAVEVTLKNGDQLDVHLDERFRVVGTECLGSDDD